MLELDSIQAAAWWLVVSARVALPPPSSGAYLTQTLAEIEDFSGLTHLLNSITGVFSGIPFSVKEARLPAQYRDISKSTDEPVENKAQSDAMRLYLKGHPPAVAPWISLINRHLSDSKITRSHPTKGFIYGGELDQFGDNAIISAHWLSMCSLI
ncbi:hypothetical protein BDV38DRAFT_280268 [Aspergillus pseudotamarii]|uniref:Uncharacterized protein n=1 Tax=Aspergillus pseudotamarii TaxID=132259 RepID=A0A5N6T1V6_ASPPS|nr:uncharacterized protein BDV38DRAFT_280268 [Aspergillus pseudotamarii]KAE8140272.1 hypothetical protein BDV38DRAFT_280268 [Aspergillus pseudotamarii]